MPTQRRSPARPTPLEPAQPPGQAQLAQSPEPTQLAQPPRPAQLAQPPRPAQLAQPPRPAQLPEPPEPPGLADPTRKTRVAEPPERTQPPGPAQPAEPPELRQPTRRAEPAEPPERTQPPGPAQPAEPPMPANPSGPAAPPGRAEFAEPPGPAQPPGLSGQPMAGARKNDSGAESPQVPVDPCHSPETGRPFPDLMALRLVKVPDPSPPFDDELSPAPFPAPAEELPYAPPSPAELSASADDLPPARAADVQPARRRVGRAHAQPIKSGPGRASDPELGLWPSQFAQVLAETLAGSRPASQIVPWTTERARAHIRRLGPLLAMEQRPRVQRVVTSRPADGVVEFAAIVGFGPRTRALAGRLERASPRPATPGRPARQARWLCTAIESA
jgi:hypothetical protein